MDLPEPDRSRMHEVNRTTLQLWEWGDPSDPPVICVHGAFDHGRMWDGIAPRIAERGFHVVAPDLRGHGNSGRMSNGHQWQTMAMDIGLLARDLGPPAGLVGHSMGAGQAMYAAGVWPEWFSWVLNLDGLGPPEDGFDSDDPMAERARRGLDTHLRYRTRPPRPQPSRDEMARRRAQINVRLPPEWLEHLVRHGTREAEGGYVWKSDPVFTVGLPGPFDLDHLHAELHLLQCPALVLTGTEADGWSDLDADAIERRMAHLPTATHELVDGAGHYVHVEAPDEVLRAFDAFLERIGATG